MQDVAGIRAIDIDGPGEDMAARTFVRDLLVRNRTKFGLDLIGLTPAAARRSGLLVIMVSMVTVSPDLMRSTGLAAAE